MPDPMRPSPMKPTFMAKPRVATISTVWARAGSSRGPRSSRSDLGADPVRRRARVLTSVSGGRARGGPDDAQGQRQDTAAGQQGAGDQRPRGERRPAQARRQHARHRRPAKEGVVDKEAGQLAAKGCEPVHWGASARRGATARAAASATSRNIAAKKTSARSSPGQATPRPSPVQNTPKAESITPTANFKVFSGTCARGRLKA